MELDPCRANAVAKTKVLRGIGLLSLTQGLANCIFILIDLVLNHVFGPKNVQFQGQRYSNHLLSDPDQFIYYTHFFMRHCRSDITILMHLSIWCHANLLNVRFFKQLTLHHFSEIIVSHCVQYCFDYAIKNGASINVTSQAE